MLGGLWVNLHVYVLFSIHNMWNSKDPDKTPFRNDKCPFAMRQCPPSIAVGYGLLVVNSLLIFFFSKTYDGKDTNT